MSYFTALLAPMPWQAQGVALEGLGTQAACAGPGVSYARPVTSSLLASCACAKQQATTSSASCLDDPLGLPTASTRVQIHVSRRRGVSAPVHMQCRKSASAAAGRRLSHTVSKVADSRSNCLIRKGACEGQAVLGDVTERQGNHQGRLITCRNHTQVWTLCKVSVTKQ